MEKGFLMLQKVCLEALLAMHVKEKHDWVSSVERETLEREQTQF